MTNATRMDKMIQGLLPLESYRSPWIPTRRLGQDALVAVAAPFRQHSDSSIAPSTWFATNPDFSTLLAFARTSVVTPVADFQSGPLEPRTTTMTTREAHAALWRMSERDWPDFFALQRPRSEIAADIEAAFTATVPDRLQPWLRLCCADFFEWITTDRVVNNQ